MARLQQDVTSCTWEIEVPGVDHRALETRRGCGARGVKPPCAARAQRARGGRRPPPGCARASRVREPRRDAACCKRSWAPVPEVCALRSLAGLSVIELGLCAQNPSMDRERRLPRRASRTGRSSASNCGLGACVVTSSRRDFPNVRQLGRQSGQHTTGTGGPGT